MRETIGLILIVVIIASFGRWLYVHWRFWSILREEHPDLYKKISAGVFAHARGRGWINFALEGSHRGLGNDRLEKAGDALANAYGKFQVSFAILWLVSATLFGFSWLFFSA